MSYHRIIFTQHALERMRERRISRAQVEQTINQPDSVRMSRTALVAERLTMSGNILRVVYREERGARQVVSALVITAMRISGPGGP